MLLQPSSELVVVPAREDVVLGVIELLGCFSGSISGLGRKSLVAGRSLAVGGRNRLGSLVGGVAVDGGGSSGSPVCQLTLSTCMSGRTGSLQERGAVHGWTWGKQHPARGGIPSIETRTI